MDLGVEIPTEVKKKIFRLRPMKSNGLILKIHHTMLNTKMRFIHSCFHRFNNIVALANNQGNIFIINYSSNKFWGLIELHSSTFIEFSPINDNHLLIGTDNGAILICNMDSGHICGKLLGHKYNVCRVSFAKKKFLLSASKYEALVWDLETATKLQVLNLEENCSLKYVSFIPTSGNILACFQDDLIQIWSHVTFETKKQFSPSNWKSYSVKSISFTRDGQVMVVAGYLPTLSVFHLESSKLLKTISLSDYLQTIKCTEFISQPFDGGCNKMLAVLSGQGILYFLNVEEDVVVSELNCNMEVNRFVCSPNGNHMACLLCSGEVEIFNIQQYVAPPVEVRVQRVRKKFRVNRKRCLEEVKVIKEEIDDILNIKKLKFILQEYGEYPETYRTKIWERLLELPNNLYKYNSVINHVTVISFDNLYQKYPLEDKIFLKSLKKLLNNIVTWCPFFANVEYLPIFAFPFVKVFHNTPLFCFEAVCTVILNWCQHWFEYFPLAPINVLAIAENILLEHDPELLHHFVTLKITSNLFIWSLLETVFSEVLTSTEWLILWDHILTNEVSFLLCASVAYNIVQRHILMSLKTTQDFECFYKNQNPIDAKRLIKVTYCLVKNTSAKFHPRQYFKKFASIERGRYPLFIEYPRKIVEFQKDALQRLDGQMTGLLAEQKSLIGMETDAIDDVVTKERTEEEIRRMKEIENFYSMQIKTKRQMLNLERQRLQEMKKTFMEKHGSGPPAIFRDILGQCNDSLYSTCINRAVGVGQGKDKKELYTKHQEKLQMAMNVELVNKFIKTIESELKRIRRKLTKDRETKNKSEDRQIRLEELLKILMKVLQQNKKLSSGLQTAESACRRHDTEECFCEVVCPKTVRFSESTTGGSVD